ncbi:putative endonuclease [Saccharicrinis carchari]|uniref:Putative endonuclease n=1 Tax=Saccharicrinis carchari TaxID=1168039 RepID=A0A521BY62_SACCC|nr:GIY-YIG nuclease family protein [Saccharicrinis carchari]SMO52117.1 putative endonuclease [Saccharicrinis carchari]
MPHFVYIIHSQSKDRYYIGSCADIKKRIDRHNAGATPSTKPHRPWTVVYSEVFPNKSDAFKREIYIKRMKSRKYIEKLILDAK